MVKTKGLSKEEKKMLELFELAGKVVLKEDIKLLKELAKH